MYASGFFHTIWSDCAQEYKNHYMGTQWLSGHRSAVTH